MPTISFFDHNRDGIRMILWNLLTVSCVTSNRVDVLKSWQRLFSVLATLFFELSVGVHGYRGLKKVLNASRVGDIGTRFFERIAIPVNPPHLNCVRWPFWARS